VVTTDQDAILGSTTLQEGKSFSKFDAVACKHCSVVSSIEIVHNLYI